MNAIWLVPNEVKPKAMPNYPFSNMRTDILSSVLDPPTIWQLCPLPSKKSKLSISAMKLIQCWQQRNYPLNPSFSLFSSWGISFILHTSSLPDHSCELCCCNSFIETHYSLSSWVDYQHHFPTTFADVVSVEGVNSSGQKKKEVQV